MFHRMMLGMFLILAWVLGLITGVAIKVTDDPPKYYYKTKMVWK